MIRVLLAGAAGRMGRTIARIAEDNGAVVVAGIDRAELPGSPFPVYSSPADVPADLAVDVVIDFSHPSLFEDVLELAVARSLPVVVATTGLSDAQRAKLSEAAEHTTVFFSANYSLGINLLIDLVQKAAAVLNGYDIEIIEKHHNQKLDAPSGTALAIADALKESLDRPTHYMYDRHAVRQKRDPNEIGIHAVRGGTIVGEHEVLFAGLDEMVEITHKAASRDVFAVGALRAAGFVCGKSKGLYSMKDLVAEI